VDGVKKMSLVSEERLEQIEFEIIEDRHTKFTIEQDKARLYWGLGFMVGWIVIDFLTLSFIKPTNAETDFAILSCSLVFGSMVAFIVGGITANYITERKLISFARINIENKKELMLQRVFADYDMNDDIKFFKNIFDSELIDNIERENIEKFLTSEGKTLSDYLNLLNEKELTILTEPYKQKLATEITAKIDEYFVKKDKESVQNLDFHKNGKEFFYSNLPKNLAQRR